MLRQLVGRVWTIAGFLLLQVLLKVSRHWSENLPSNCFIWAFRQQQWFGGEFLLRPSAYGPWLHCQWVSPEGEVWEFNPPKKRRSRFPPLLFYGSAYRVK